MTIGVLYTPIFKERNVLYRRQLRYCSSKSLTFLKGCFCKYPTEVIGLPSFINIVLIKTTIFTFLGKQPRRGSISVKFWTLCYSTLCGTGFFEEILGNRFCWFSFSFSSYFFVFVN